MIRTGIRAIASATALTFILAGCSSPPTTTYVDEGGDEVTVSWADYPGHAYTDASDVLAAPRERDVPTRAAALFAEIQGALAAEFPLQWHTSGEAGWYPASGNGYGGDSAYLTYNSEGRHSDTIPAAAEDWHRIVHLVSGIADRNGVGTIVLDHESAALASDPAWQDDLLERYGTDDPDRYWSWSGTAYRDSQWLSLVLTDVERDPSGEAAEEHERTGWARSISLSYGATTIPDASRTTVERALEPFLGLEKPEATTSD